jgi:hypothetical protein
MEPAARRSVDADIRMKVRVIRFFILFAAMDFRIEPPLLLETQRSVKWNLENFVQEKNSPLTASSYGSSVVYPR